QVELDRRAGLGLRPALDGELAFAVGAPRDSGFRRLAGLAALDLDPVRDDERRIEADAELADQLRILALIPAQFLDEPLRPGVRDRAELLDDLVASHSDAVIGDRDRLRVAVDRDDDLEIRRLRGKLGTGERLEAQLVVRVGRVRYQ